MQSILVELLVEYTRRITISTRSKRWWNDDVRDRRKALGRITTRTRRGLDKEDMVKVARRELHRAIKRAQRECSEECINRDEGGQVCAITRYTKPQRSAAAPKIRHRGTAARR